MHTRSLLHSDENREYLNQRGEATSLKPLLIYIIALLIALKAGQRTLLAVLFHFRAFAFSARAAMLGSVLRSLVCRPVPVSGFAGQAQVDDLCHGLPPCALVNSGGNPGMECAKVCFIDAVRRHDVDRVAQRAEQ